MTDLERRLQESLKSVGENYHPTDPSAARTRFLTRRKRRQVGAWSGAVVLAGTAAAVAFFVFAESDPVTKQIEKGKPADLPVAAPTLKTKVAARIDVGDEPSGIAVGGGYVWVANSAEDTVSQIDPDTNEVVEVLQVPGGPDDVLVHGEYTWVSSADGSFYRFPSQNTGLSQIPGEQFGEFPTDTHLDLAPASNGDLWVLVPAPDAVLERVGDGEIASAWTSGIPIGTDPTDVSAFEDQLWVYDRGQGEVVHVDPTNGERIATTVVGRSESADLKTTETFTWLFLGDTGTLVQIDNATAEIVTETTLGGTFGAITADDGAVYVMVTEGGPDGTGEGRLYQLDANSAARIGNPISLSDVPADVEAGLGGIWITNEAADQVTRVDLVPDDSTTVAESPAPDTEVLFYLAQNGDIFSYDIGGDLTPVIAEEAYESSPSISPDGSSLIYQTGESFRGRTEIWFHDLTGEGNLPEGELFPGEAPEFGPTGVVAWGVPGNGGKPTTVAVGELFSEPQATFEADPEWTLGPLTVDDIAWTSDGRTLYYMATWEEPGLYSADIEEQAVSQVTVSDPEAATYVSPAVHQDGTTTVVRLCCGLAPDYNFTTAELVTLNGDQYTKITGLDDLDPSTFEWWVEPAGYLDYETDTGWSVGEYRSWLVGNGDDVWLVNENGESNALGLEGATGAAVVPGGLE
jgi:YVTN family beta-propeller protein